MANRVLIDSNNFKVSKSGVNVLTANNSQLLLHNNATSLGVFQTGIVSPSIASPFFFYLFSPYFRIQYEPQEFVLVNPTNDVPLLLFQRIDGSQSWGGGYYSESDTSAVFVYTEGGVDYISDQPPEDEDPESGYWIIFITNSIYSRIGAGGHLLNGVDRFQIDTFVFNNDYRYAAFFTDVSDDDEGTIVKDRTPNSFSFEDMIVLGDGANTLTKTITGIDYGFFMEASLDQSLTSGEKFRATVTSPGSSPITNQIENSGNTLTFQVLPDSELFFSFESTASKVLNVTLYNLNDGNAVLDNFNIGVNTADTFLLPVDWNNLNGTGYATSNVETTEGINTPVTLRFQLPSNLDSYEYFGLFVNNIFYKYTSGSTFDFDVSNKDDVRLSYYAARGQTGTITVTNLENGNSVDTVPINIGGDNSIPENINNLTFGSFTGTNFSGNTVTSTSPTRNPNGYSGNATFNLSLSATFQLDGGFSFPSTDFSIDVYVNGSYNTTVTVGSFNSTVSVPNNASLYFVARLINNDSSGVTVTGSFVITVGSAFAPVDTVPINMYAAAESGGGGGFPGGGFGGGI